MTGVWQSTAAFNGITVKQTYSIPPYAWMIDTTAELTNTTGATIDDVYLMRGVDPDNCRMESRPLCDLDTNDDGIADIHELPGTSNDYQTHNTVVSQGSATTSALVTATQTDDSYIGLRAVGGEARAFIQNGGFSNPGSLSTLWSGADPAVQLQHRQQPPGQRHLRGRPRPVDRARRDGDGAASSTWSGRSRRRSTSPSRSPSTAS